MLKKLREKFRFKIINFLNKFESSCWADLVVWATTPEGSSYMELWPYRAWHKESVWGCDCPEEQGAYCGKCYETGRLQPKVRELKHLNIDKNAKYWKLPFEPTNAENIIIEFKK